MDEERKTPVPHAEMCFPDWVNESGCIKDVNQPHGCLGSTWAGLLMRQKPSRTAFPKEGRKGPVPSRAPQRLHDLWPRQVELNRSGWRDFCQAHSTMAPLPSAKGVSPWKTGRFSWPGFWVGPRMTFRLSLPLFPAMSPITSLWPFPPCLLLLGLLGLVHPSWENAIGSLNPTLQSYLSVSLCGELGAQPSVEVWHPSLSILLIITCDSLYGTFSAASVSSSI